MLFALLGFIVGTILGSLALALADRSLNNQTFFGWSHCPNCQHNLTWFDLVPIFSYLLLHGKCRYCQRKIKLEYLQVEVVMGVAVGILFWESWSKLLSIVDQYQLIILLADLISKIFIITILVILTITDLKKTIIPDRITYPAIKIILIYLTALVGFKIWWLYQSLIQSSIGSYLIHKSDFFWRHSLDSAEILISGLIMALIIGLFFLALIVITKGRGMGGGDLKLGILIGLYLGYPKAIVAILLSFVTGSLVAIFLILIKKKHFGQTIPFGPFLSLGAILTIFAGDQINSFYNSFNLILIPFPWLK